MKKLFDKKPTQWGLRGDPFLWEELQEHFSTKIWMANKDDFEQELMTAFQLLTGEELVANRTILIERYQSGGMSNGMISSDFWIENAFPLLIERYLEFKPR